MKVPKTNSDAKQFKSGIYLKIRQSEHISLTLANIQLFQCLLSVDQLSVYLIPHRSVEKNNYGKTH